MDTFLKTTVIDASILHITLNRPEALNVLNAELMKELYNVLIKAQNDATIKAVLITGEGKAFCAGADIKQLSILNSQTGLAFARQGQSVFRLLEQLGKPSLAAIHGFAFGGGCELAMAATLRIATDTSLFGQPEVKLGVIPGFGGTQRLARLVGKGRALDLCVTGRTLKANDALAWGLVNEIVTAEVLPERGKQILRDIIKLAPFALKSVMTVIDEGFDLPLTEAMEWEASHFGACCATQDKTEGVNAFLEKRPAHFVGE